MIRTLAMIAIAGFFVAVLSLSGAAALGGYDINKHGGWSFPVQWDWDDDDNDRADMRRIDWNTPETTRTIEWAGADRIEIAIPADVTFTQAPTPSLVVTGPRDAVEHVIVEGVNVAKKATKPNPMTGVTGGIVDKTMPIHVSNVALFNAATGKADRVGFKDQDGKKVRVFKSSGEVVKG